MNLFSIRREQAEFSDGEIDLTRIHIPKADPYLRFGHETVWRISLHGSRKEIGQISYRDGESPCVFYYGHVGYHIDPPWRGHHYAQRACMLIESEIYRSGKSSIIITCDPDNLPSRKTCEKLGCIYEGTVSVPDEIYHRFEINRVKCRYIWRVGNVGGKNVC